MHVSTEAKEAHFYLKKMLLFTKNTTYPYILFTIPSVSVLFTLSPVKTVGPRSFIFCI